MGTKGKGVVGELPRARKNGIVHREEPVIAASTSTLALARNALACAAVAMTVVVLACGESEPSGAQHSGGRADPTGCGTSYGGAHNYATDGSARAYVDARAHAGSGSRQPAGVGGRARLPRRGAWPDGAPDLPARGWRQAVPGAAARADRILREPAGRGGAGGVS